MEAKILNIEFSTLGDFRERVTEKLVTSYDSILFINSANDFPTKYGLAFNYISQIIYNYYGSYFLMSTVNQFLDLLSYSISAKIPLWQVKLTQYSQVINANMSVEKTNDNTSQVDMTGSRNNKVAQARTPEVIGQTDILDYTNYKQEVSGTSENQSSQNFTGQVTRGEKYKWETIEKIPDEIYKEVISLLSHLFYMPLDEDIEVDYDFSYYIKDLYTEIADIERQLDDYATKGDLENYAKLTDLTAYALLSDLDDYAKLTDLSDYAKVTDLSGYAKLTDLSSYAQISDLSNYATLTDISDFITLTDLTPYAKLTDLTPYAKTVDVSSTYATKNALSSGLSSKLNTSVWDSDNDTYYKEKYVSNTGNEISFDMDYTQSILCEASSQSAEIEIVVEGGTYYFEPNGQPFLIEIFIGTGFYYLKLTYATSSSSSTLITPSVKILKSSSYELSISTRGGDIGLSTKCIDRQIRG